MFKRLLYGLALAFFMAGAARAQTVTCPAVTPGEELRDLPEIRADRAKKTLDTTLSVQLRTLCLPTMQNDRSWLNLPTQLRAYGFPDPDKAGQWVWGFPGPVLRLRKAEVEGGTGDSLSILLKNELPVGSDTGCDSACPATVSCTPPIPDPGKCASPGIPDPRCCCWVKPQAPNCFHGDNNTNLHFHGSHVSPQFPQDDVLLELRPAGASHTAHGSHGSRSDVFYGEVQYKLDPLLWTQPEGTHWYHPHKHGSVSLQVTNGMAGPLIVEGPFDDWLRLYYGGKLKEKILVIQTVEAGTNLYAQGASSLTPPLPPPLINGQLQPIVTMAPGEVQRWRFINVTLNALSQLNVQFPKGAVVRQIAMDGIRFAPENYDRQPLFNGENTFQIAPGNRADFLVQAPAAVGDHPVTHRIFGHLGERRRLLAEARDEALAPGPADPALVTIRVQPRFEAALPAATGFPGKDLWPPMPSYLKDIQPDEIQGTVNLSFNMTHPNADPRAEFNISGVQFDGSCVNVTTSLGSALEWNVQNTTNPLHPFHIHINPFQVIRNAGQTYTPPYVWQDTIALPQGSESAPASVLLRHRYTDFTGEYVLHCHFLGHEDRGMMYAVQTVCPKDPGSFGKARPGGQSECVEGNLVKASPSCPSNPVTLRK